MSKTYSQYRITVNGTQSAITDEYPGARWEYLAELSDNRAIEATFERRLVAPWHPGIEQLYPGLRCDDLYISRWGVIAEIQPR